MKCRESKPSWTPSEPFRRERPPHCWMGGLLDEGLLDEGLLDEGLLDEWMMDC